jgi:hypothetical protein
MPKYHVHAYPVGRVLIRDIEADSQASACHKAEEAVDFIRLFRAGAVEYADGIDGFLVDEDGDTEHTKSRFYSGGEV